MKTTHNHPAFVNMMLVYVLAASLFISSGAFSQTRTKIGSIPEVHPEYGLGVLQGYLNPNEVPNSLALLPPPPAPSSAAFKLDEETASGTFALRNTPRFALAASDYDLRISHLVEVFACALDMQITKDNAPYMYTILCRAFSDIGLSTQAAKLHYKRLRPFQVNGQPIAVPEAKTLLESDGSYPSGHTAIGWGFALILSEIAPDRANEILLRGREYGESRMVCNHHWYSDVIWGRFMGAATVAVLHSDPTFKADMEAARAEYKALRAKGIPLTCDCKTEAAEMSLGYQSGTK